jgi:hypothetical protein
MGEGLVWHEDEIVSRARATADTVAYLEWVGFIRLTPEIRDTLCDAFGVVDDDLQSAQKRVADFDAWFEAIDEGDPVEKVIRRPPAVARRRKWAVEDRPENMKHASRKRPTREIDGVTHLYCSGDGVDLDSAHWAPETWFIPKADHPHRRVAWCDDHRLAYQRARRLNKKALAEIEAVGLQLRLDADSHLIGVACRACGEPFSAGDDVDGRTTLRHITCAAADAEMGSAR